MRKSKKSNAPMPDPNEWIFDERNWLLATVVVGVLSILLLFCFIPWLAQSSTVDEVTKKIEVFKTLATILGAIVTVLTVIWRGMVTTRQTDEQGRQNDAKEEENIAKLLIDGTKLVTDKDGTQATVLAGIAALEAVIAAPNGRFSSHAMDIIGEPIQNWFRDSIGTVLLASIRAMDAGIALGRNSNRQVCLSTVFENGNWGDEPISAINGFKHVKYIGGSFYREEYKKIRDFEKFEFTSTSFNNCQNICCSLYLECNFQNCEIETFYLSLISLNEFNNCDFSGSFLNLRRNSTQTTARNLKNLKNNGNYYYTNNPPEPLPGIVWSDYLEARDPL